MQRIFNSKKPTRRLPWVSDGGCCLSCEVLKAAWGGRWAVVICLKTWLEGACFCMASLPNHIKVLGFCWNVPVVTWFHRPDTLEGEGYGDKWSGKGSRAIKYSEAVREPGGLGQPGSEPCLWTLGSRWSHWPLIAQEAREGARLGLKWICSELYFCH